MSEQKFNIKKVNGNFVAFDANGISYGKISIKTGKFVGDTRCLIALRNHFEASKPKVVKTTYKLWVVIEETKVLANGKEVIRDLTGEGTRSCGAFSTLEEAHEQMNKIGEEFEGDFTKDEKDLQTRMHIGNDDFCTTCGDKVSGEQHKC